jgi:hypothetical protein
MIAVQVLVVGNQEALRHVSRREASWVEATIFEEPLREAG